MQFLSQFLYVLDASRSSFCFASNFESREVNFWGAHVLIFCSTAKRDSIITKSFFLSFQTELRDLCVNKTKITTVNAFNGGYFETADIPESSNDKRNFFLVFLQIFYQCFNHLVARDIYQPF